MFFSLPQYRVLFYGARSTPASSARGCTSYLFSTFMNSFALSNQQRQPLVPSVGMPTRPAKRTSRLNGVPNISPDPGVRRYRGTQLNLNTDIQLTSPGDVDDDKQARYQTTSFTRAWKGGTKIRRSFTRRLNLH